MTTSKIVKTIILVQLDSKWTSSMSSILDSSTCIGASHLPSKEAYTIICSLPKHIFFQPMRSLLKFWGCLMKSPDARFLK